MTKPDFYTLPQAMYNLDVIKCLLVDENNAILHKRLTSDMLNMEKIIVSHSIVYIKSGTVKVQTYDYEEFSIGAGEMLFMPRDSYLISDYIQDDKEMEVYLFFFDHMLSSEFIQNRPTPPLNATSAISKIEVSKNIETYINVLGSMNYVENNKHLLKVKLFELLHLICESNENFSALLYEHEAKKMQTDLQTYMLEHYDKNLSINDWASLSGYSLSTFNRKFKKEYGKSPKKWMLKQTMKLAHTALQNGTNVSECALDFGYANSSNFIKAYKEIYNTTPKKHHLT